ncbi:MAG: SDR family oxidoreductase [Acidobacteriota bacterium]
MTSNNEEIAIIGMAGRFPGANNIAEFWQNLHDGVESISFFSDQQLLSSGIDQATLNDPNYVKAAGVLQGIELFDAQFFGFSPREAEIMDPQHRLFLEVAWEALEEAGYNCDIYSGRVGVYAGAGMNTYLLFNLFSNSEFVRSAGDYQIMIGNDKDFLPTRISYKLNLRGPSINVQTACSTSLTAVCLACQGLLSYQCDMALAGGVSIRVPNNSGYIYQPGGILSPDGHCRAFDAKAQGTVVGSGVGIVVLKRLEDALQDGDYIHAVIKGSAINNDGSLKVGYTAPSIDGQAEVIAEACAMSEVPIETISYIETHGTGTALGDPIEVAALNQVFRARTSKKNFCALGSVKTNVGHLDTVAGVAGLIKTVLALKHKQLPASLHFESPNPQFDLTNSPFYINNRLSQWPADHGPRRAGVSSFGIGGTNAHVVVEEVSVPESSPSLRPWQLLLLSAKTETALEAVTANLAEYLKVHPGSNLADVAYTYQVGRKVFNYRRFLVCQNVEDAIAGLEQTDANHRFTAFQKFDDRQTVFMFPGGGAQYVNMGLGLYRTEAVFREQVDLCAHLLKDMLGFDIREWIYPSPERLAAAGEELKRTSIALPALFTIEFATAKLLMSFGIVPAAMIGHSLGDYVAACLSQVFSLQDALALVVTRGKLFDKLPKGGMLSVPLAEAEIRPLIGDRLSIAAVNAPCQCVVSGPLTAIEEVSTILDEQEIEYRRLQIDVAAHSQMVSQIRAPFREFIAKLKLYPPKIPFISNVSGNWISDREATDPGYWTRHLTETVRFGQGIAELLKEEGRTLVEVGPGQNLSTLARLQVDAARGQSVISCLRHPYERQSDEAYLLTALGKLWLVGVSIDWAGFHREERRQRLPLPGYPFERQRYWIEAEIAQMGNRRITSHLEKKSDISSWFYYPSWKRSWSPHSSTTEDSTPAMGKWLLFVDDSSIADGIVERLKNLGVDLTRVIAGNCYDRLDDQSFVINSQIGEDYHELLKDLRETDRIPDTIVHLWNVTREIHCESERELFEKCQQRGFYSLLYLAQALSAMELAKTVRLLVVANEVFAVENTDRVLPEKATILAPGKVIPQENDRIACRFIDITLSTSQVRVAEELNERLWLELTQDIQDAVVAIRGMQRWIQTFEPVYIAGNARSASRLRSNGVYLITGGLGSIGLTLAEYLAKNFQASLILTSRTPFPARDQWQRWLVEHEQNDPLSDKISKLQLLEEYGAEVIVACADVADAGQMERVIEEGIRHFGALHGIIHAAGITGEQAISLIPEISRENCEQHFQAKAHGLYVLEKLTQELGLDFCLLCSSTTSILGGLGTIGYTAANIFMDAFANSHRRGCRSWISVNWDGWLQTGEERLSASFQTSIDKYAMKTTESVEAFRRVVDNAYDQIIVSTGDLASRLDLWINRNGGNSVKLALAENQTPQQRPYLTTSYLPPTNELEETIARIWQDVLGIDRLGVNDNFFELGGNSLIGLKVIARLKKELAIDIPVVSLFEGPTISALAKVISADPQQPPLCENSQSRGERRRERRLKNQALEEAVTKLAKRSGEDS